MSFQLLAYLIIALFTAQANATPHGPIRFALQPGNIVIIGESHQKRESVQLFHDIVTDYLQAAQCLTVALEIASNQQTIIDQVMQGRASASAIAIPAMIDYPPYRKMIGHFAALKSKGACLKLVAIDAGEDIAMRRDAWMAVKLAEQGNNTPILALLGNLHTLKKVDWDVSMTTPSPFVAEILSVQGYEVYAYPQHWEKGHCDGKAGQYGNRFIPAGKPEALSLLNATFISLINAFDYQSAIGVIDCFVVWQCNPK